MYPESIISLSLQNMYIMPGSCNQSNKAKIKHVKAILIIKREKKNSRAMML